MQAFLCTLLPALVRVSHASPLLAASVGATGISTLYRNVTVLALSGSLRRLSANSALARSASAVSPFVVLAPRLDALPFFNADMEAAPPLPVAVASLRAQAFAADAFIFATPEYNAAIPAVLKNAIDWLSRDGPEGALPLYGKPYGVVSAAGRSGGRRAQANLAAVLADSAMVLVGDAVSVNLWDGKKRFSSKSGNLTDTSIREDIRVLVKALLEAGKRARRQQ